MARRIEKHSDSLNLLPIKELAKGKIYGILLVSKKLLSLSHIPTLSFVQSSSKGSNMSG